MQFRRHRGALEILYKWLDTLQDGVVINKGDKIVYFNQKVRSIYDLGESDIYDNIKDQDRSHLK